MYKIIVDSCGELPEELKKNSHFSIAPLTLTVDGYDIVDDDTFDQADFLRRVAESKEAPKSACPSPDEYLSRMNPEADNNYIVTLSSQLSGSYNSALVAKDMFLEDYPDKNVLVIDSKSASIGQSLICFKIDELEKQGLGFEEITAAVDEYVEGQHTFFILETLDTLRKNGRLSNIKAFIASTLNIKPVMGSTDIGTIQQLGQARGMSRAIDKLVTSLVEVTENTEQKILAISHCNCVARALEVKDKILAVAKFKDVVILDTAGVSTMYANDGGIVVVA